MRRILPDRPLTRAESDKRYYAAHREQRKARRRAYYALHRMEGAVYSKKRYAALTQSEKSDRAHSSTVKYRYHMTMEQYAVLLRSQDGRCAICERGPKPGGRLHIDHDHSCCPNKAESCGKCVRGLLCENCNHAVGLFEDDLVRLQKAIDYLTRRHS